MLFNQQQCFIYSTASFLSKLRAKKVEKLHNSSFYRKLNTGIGFRNRERLFPVLSIIKKKKLIPTDRPKIFLTCDSKHTYIFFWPYGSFSHRHLPHISFYFYQRGTGPKYGSGVPCLPLKKRLVLDKLIL